MPGSQEKKVTALDELAAAMGKVVTQTQIELYEERAAILEYLALYPREKAERVAARMVMIPR